MQGWLAVEAAANGAVRRGRQLPRGPGVADEAIVESLLRWVSRLANAAARQPPVPYVATTWNRWLRAMPSSPSLDEECSLSWVGLTGKKVSRADLRRLAAAGDGPSDNLRLLIAALVWGRGRRNARMFPHTMVCLKAPGRDDVLAATADAARAGRLADAYDAWTLPGLREPFFTKWLWAVGTRAQERVARPLVLDSRVRATLKALGWNSVKAAGTRRRSVRYATYCEATVRWGALLSEHGRTVSAEDLEYALFFAGGELTRLTELPVAAAPG